MTDVRRTVDAVWKLESARIVGGLVRLVRDVGLAEELAQDALVAALEQWPEQGVPDNPGAWLTTVARRRAVDRIRREQREVPAGERIAYETESAPDPQDDALRLMFVSCHPVLSPDARVALTLRLLGGLTAAEIGRAFLAGETRIARRIAAAKQTLAAEGVEFELPSGPELAARLSSVLGVLYLIFNEGYSATAGDDLIRADLCREALRLGRMLAELAPDEPEVHGLVALMEIQASRAAARTGPAGELVLLHEQQRGRWDQLLIRRGFAAMLRARGTGRHARAVRAAGRHRGLPRTGPHGGGDRLAANRDAVRRAGPPVAHAGRAAQPRGGARHGAGSRRRPRRRRRVAGRPGPARLPPAARRPRRPPGPAGPPRGGRARVPPRRIPHPKRRRAGIPAPPSHRDDEPTPPRRQHGRRQHGRRRREAAG